MNSVTKHKVYHILTGKERGGISRVVSGIYHGLDRARWEVTLLIIGRNRDAFRNFPETIHHPQTNIFSVMQFLRLFRAIKRDRVDIIHTHSIIPNLYGFIINKLDKRIRHVVHVHANFAQVLQESQSSRLRRVVLIYLTRMILRKCRSVIVNSQEVSNYLEGLGVRPGKISLVYNGVDAGHVQSMAGEKSAIALNKDKRLVGSVGRLVPIKNYPLLLRAFQNVAGQNEDVELVIVGDGNERSNLKRLAADLGIADKVTFTGWQDNPYPLMKSMDILVLASDWEGLGIALLEGMALEKAVIATRAGGLPEVVDDRKNGILFPPGDAGALSDAIVSLLKDNGMRMEMGRRGLQKAERSFSLQCMTDGVEGVYRSLIGIN